MTALAEVTMLPPQALRAVRQSTDTASPETNYLLARVDPAELEVLRRHWQRVTVGLGENLIRPKDRIRYAYFPENFIGSIIALPDNERVEAASVGCEGFVGYQAALLHGRTFSETVVQIEGDGHRIEVAELERLLPHMPSLRRELERYVLTVLEETAINAACHGSHNLDRRAARWLLHMNDRANRPVFRVTHKYLSAMLGVRRSGVTVAAGKLQMQRLIRYTRGKMEILDRPGLEASACRCYRIVEQLQRDGLPNQ